MTKQDIDKTVSAIDSVLKVLPDIMQVEGKGKTRIFGYIGLIFKHGGKVIKVFKNGPEIFREIIDLDDQEATQIYDKLAPHFGGSEAAKKNIRLLAEGFGKINQGVQGLISVKNK